jgi:hypothetical protein
MKTIKMLMSAAIVSITCIAMAQSDDNDNRDKFQFGLKAGMNYSNVYNTKTEEFTANGKLGFAGGAVVHIPLGKIIGIQPELLISQKGFKGSGTLLGNDYSFTRTSTFLDIPIQLAIKPAKFLTIVAGPQYSFLLRQKDSFKSTLYSNDQEQVFRNDNIRRNILGFVAGFDVHIKHIVVGGRAGLDFIKNNGDGSSDTPRYKNAWLQATIGYTFYKNN